MNNLFSKTKQLSAVLVLFFLGCSYLSNAQESNLQDLVFVAAFDSYDTWYNTAFKVDAERRSSYCQENRTTTGKISNNEAIISLQGFDMTRMPEFASDKKMAELMKSNNIRHDEVYRVTAIEERTGSNSKIGNLLFKVKSIDFDLWYENAFAPDAERRSAFCDENKTKVAKVSDKEAMVILYDFQLEKLGELGDDKNIGDLMKTYQVEHEVFVLETL